MRPGDIRCAKRDSMPANVSGTVEGADTIALVSRWQDWHRAYDDPDSPLARRLAIVQQCIADALDAAPPGPVRVISMCAGEGRDLLGVLAAPSARRRCDRSARRARPRARGAPAPPHPRASKCVRRRVDDVGLRRRGAGRPRARVRRVRQHRRRRHRPHDPHVAVALRATRDRHLDPSPAATGSHRARPRGVRRGRFRRGRVRGARRLPVRCRSSPTDARPGAVRTRRRDVRVRGIRLARRDLRGVRVRVRPRPRRSCAGWKPMPRRSSRGCKSSTTRRSAGGPLPTCGHRSSTRVICAMCSGCSTGAWS